MHKNTTYNGYQNELRVTNIVKIINRLQLILIEEKLQFSIMHMPMCIPVSICNLSIKLNNSIECTQIFKNTCTYIHEDCIHVYVQSCMLIISSSFNLEQSQQCLIFMHCT